MTASVEAPERPLDCPVCGEPYLVFVTRKRTVRTHRDLPVFGCLACRSFSNPSGYVEDDAQLVRDLEWHKSVEARNEKASQALLTGLIDAGVDISKIVDIGAGTGTLLRVAQEKFGSACLGYEVNPLTQPYARLANGVDVRAELWSSDTDSGSYTALLCIMVLEHLPKPRELVRQLVKGCLAQGASLFVSVPFLDRDRWHFLTEPDPRAAQNPFFDNDVHVTHFSSNAMEALLREFGMTSLVWIRQGLWHGILARP